MRANYRWLGAALLGCWLTSQAFGQQAISWQVNIDAARRVAAQTNRLVLIHFWSTSCGPCQQMEREVFSRPDVAAAIDAAYVPVKLNVDNFAATARQFGITALPTDIVITPQGQIVDKRVGGKPAGAYVNMLNQIAANTRRDATPASTQLAAAVPGPMAPGANPNPEPNGYGANASVPFIDPDRPRAAQPNVGATAGPMAPAPYGAGMAMSPANGFAPSSPDPRFAGAPAGNPAGMAPMNNLPANVPATAPALADAPAGRPTWSPMAQGAASTAIPNGLASGASGNWQAANGQAAPGMSAAPPRAEASAPSSVPVGNPPLGLDGYCPVQLTEKERWVKGDPRWGLVHRGRTYLFAGPEEQNRFFADPDRYAPAACGNDVVMAVEQGQAVSGHREHGVWFDGRVYLFASEESLHRFDSDPYRYARAINPAPPSATEANRGMSAAPGQARY